MSVCFLAHIHLRTPELIHKCRQKKKQTPENKTSGTLGQHTGNKIKQG